MIYISLYNPSTYTWLSHTYNSCNVNKYLRNYTVSTQITKILHIKYTNFANMYHCKPCINKLFELHVILQCDNSNTILQMTLFVVNIEKNAHDCTNA